MIYLSLPCLGGNMPIKLMNSFVSLATSLSDPLLECLTENDPSVLIICIWYLINVLSTILV